MIRNPYLSISHFYLRRKGGDKKTFFCLNAAEICHNASEISVFSIKTDVTFERENMHRFKRHYLLCSLVLSFVIPLVALDITVPQLNEEINRLYAESNINEQVAILISQIYPEINPAGLTSEPTTFIAKTTCRRRIEGIPVTKQKRLPG